MTQDEGNNLIARYLGLKLKSDKKTWELNKELSQILKVKTTQFLKFNESLDLMFIVEKQICTIKDLFISSQLDHGLVHVYLYYKAEDIEGELRNAKFSCTREKEQNKYKQALFEVITNFLGWLEGNPECKADIEYELDYVSLNEEGLNTIYMHPKDLRCPHCGEYFDYDDVDFSKKREDEKKKN